MGKSARKKRTKSMMRKSPYTRPRNIDNILKKARKRTKERSAIRSRMNRKAKRILRKSINKTNIGVSLLAVLVGFGIVYLSYGSVGFQFKNTGQSGLIHSASRLADAFDLYNQKRFAE